MALFKCSVYSEVLGVCTSSTVIIPQETKAQVGLKGRVRQCNKHPVLYLLHGLSDDDSIWLRRTSIERYVSALGIAVVMPDAGRSFYTDSVNGHRWFTHIAEEVPALMRSFFPLSAERRYNFVAGLSMGGYGALKIALTFPDRFAAAASLSGALDIGTSMKGWKLKPREKREWESVFGRLDRIRGTRNDLFHLARKVIKGGKQRPALYFCCGKSDFLYQDNLCFKAHLEKLDYPFTYEEGKGDHEWGYWDMQIQDVLKWLPL